MKKHMGMALSVFLLAGCAGLCGQSLIDDLNMADVSGNGFNNALAREYRDLSNFEWTKMQDYKDGAHFAQKGLAAAAGEVVTPDEVASRDIPEFALADIMAGHEALATALAAGAAARHPDAAATAQAKFDCWMEQQEENHQPEDIAGCRIQFQNALAKIAASRYMVFFDTGSAKLSHAAHQVIVKAGAEARANHATHFEIVGNTDTVGAAPANRALSRSRAAAVKSALVARGFSSANIHISGAGEAAPMVATADSVKQPENRRAEIISFK